MKYFLALTANKKIWRKDKPLLLLDKNCLSIKELLDNDKYNYLISKHHWDDRKKYENDYYYLSTLYEKLISILQKELNSFHNVNYSKRFWTILIGPWTRSFLQIVYDKHESLRQVINDYEIDSCNYSENYKLIPFDFKEYQKFIQTNSWNEMILSEIIKFKFLDKIPLNKTSIEYEENINNSYKNKIIFKLKNKVFYYLNRLNLFFLFNNKVDTFLLGSYFKKKIEIKLSKKINGHKSYWYLEDISEKILKNKTIVNKKKFEIKTNNKDLSFETLIIDLMQKNIPSIYTDYFLDTIKLIKAYPWPKKTINILTSAGYYSELFKFYSGLQVEQGSNLLLYQIGGGIDSMKFSFAKDHVVEISNKYITWGWDDHSHQNIETLGIQKTYKSNLNQKNKENALLVLGSISPHSKSIDSDLNYSQLDDYILTHINFLYQFNTDLRDKIKVRFHSDENYDGDYSDIFLEKYPSLNISHSKYIYDEYSKSKIVISTYNGTTHLETLSLDIPTLVYWKPEFNEINQEAEKYYQQLYEVNIFHHDEESAANFLINNWNNIDLWWESEKVRRVRNNFSRRYCNLHGDLEKGLLNILDK